jgi:hypothetical protein
MTESYQDVSLVVLDGDTPYEYTPWGTPLRHYTAGLRRIQPWISDALKKFDRYRFEVLFDSPDELRARTGEKSWNRVVGVIVDAVHAAGDAEARDRVEDLLTHVCTSLVSQCKEPWVCEVGFHLICIVSRGEPTQKELAFRDKLATLVEGEMKIHRGHGLETYEAGDPDVFLSQMRASTTRMVAHRRYWSSVLKGHCAGR